VVYGRVSIINRFEIQRRTHGGTWVRRRVPSRLTVGTRSFRMLLTMTTHTDLRSGGTPR